jgi:hypothetical protein|tara:strand:+ start:768 stop:1772 length:1005 start_codon:yes stop_codon:yes gene_type:complete
MAVPNNTVQTYTRVGIREDLADVIYNIAPTETPFMSNAGTGSASQSNHEWQTDGLANAAANKQIEGDDAANLATVATTRLGDFTQISTKVIGVSGTDQAVTNAGRGDELAYQMAKAGKELKRDMEFTLVGQENFKTAGAAGTARELGSVGTWYGGNIPGTATAANNYSAAANTTYANAAGAVGAGLNGDGLVKRNANGTLRAYTEDLLKAGLKKTFELGGSPDCVMMTASHKQTASGFNGIATNTNNIADKRVIGAVDVYVSDFGEVTFVPNRHQQENRVDILEMDKWELSYLRPFQTKELAKTGDSDKRMLLTEYTLTARAPTANYGIFALTA